MRAAADGGCARRTWHTMSQNDEGRISSIDTGGCWSLCVVCVERRAESDHRRSSSTRFASSTVYVKRPLVLRFSPPAATDEAFAPPPPPAAALLVLVLEQDEEDEEEKIEGVMQSTAVRLPRLIWPSPCSCA